MSAAILREWNRCRRWLLPAMDGDLEDEVLNDLLTRQAQLWPGERAAVVTQLVRGAEPYLLIWKGGGDLAGLLALWPGIAAWGRMQGATAARLNGRAGWKRVLRNLGAVERDGELWKAL